MKVLTNVVVVGACGHAGLPLGVAFAQSGLDVNLLDVSAGTVDAVNHAEPPYLEPGLAIEFRNVRSLDKLEATLDPTRVNRADAVVIVIGTPVNEHMNPDPNAVVSAIGEIADHMRSGQLVVLRSTVYPGVTDLVSRDFAARGLEVDVAFCPERIAERKAMESTRTTHACYAKPGALVLQCRSGTWMRCMRRFKVPRLAPRSPWVIMFTGIRFMSDTRMSPAGLPCLHSLEHHS